MEGVEANEHSHRPNSLFVRTNTEGWDAAGPSLNRDRQSSCTQRQARLDGAMQPVGGMPELLKRQIDRLETAIDLSTDWLEIQYLMVELDQLKALYEAVSYTHLRAHET